MFQKIRYHIIILIVFISHLQAYSKNLDTLLFDSMKVFQEYDNVLLFESKKNNINVDKEFLRLQVKCLDYFHDSMLKTIHISNLSQFGRIEINSWDKNISLMISGFSFIHLRKTSHYMNLVSNRKMSITADFDSSENDNIGFFCDSLYLTIIHTIELNNLLISSNFFEKKWLASGKFIIANTIQLYHTHKNLRHNKHYRTKTIVLDLRDCNNLYSEKVNNRFLKKILKDYECKEIILPENFYEIKYTLNRRIRKKCVFK